MKTIIYTSALILALCCGSVVVAQNNATSVGQNKACSDKTCTTTACKNGACPDSVLLSKRIDGNYEIRQYLVKGTNVMESDCTVHFPINSSKMSQTFSDNTAEINSLKAFMAKLKKDTLMHVKAVKISAWASPDGTEASNLKLAKARAATWASYLMSQCPGMKNFAVESSAAVATWEDCLPMLDKLPQAELKMATDIINGNHTAAVKEAHLSKNPVVWSYLKEQVLPEFRCAEVEIHYTRASVVEQRVLIRKPAPAPAPKPESTPKPAPAQQTQPTAQNKPVVVEKNIEYIIIEDKNKGVIIEMDEANVDWE